MHIPSVYSFNHWLYSCSCIPFEDYLRVPVFFFVRKCMDWNVEYFIDNRYVHTYNLLFMKPSFLCKTDLLIAFAFIVAFIHIHFYWRIMVNSDNPVSDTAGFLKSVRSVCRGRDRLWRYKPNFIPLFKSTRPFFTDIPKIFLTAPFPSLRNCKECNC